MFKVNEGDRVIDTTGRIGEVCSVYPEINLAIVKFDNGFYGKVDFDNLYRYCENVPEPEVKKARLLDKIKGCFR